MRKGGVERSPDLVTPKLAALRSYQHTFEAPTPPPQSYDGEAAARGRTIFDRSCAGCHAGIRGTDNNSGKLHQPAETGMDLRYALRNLLEVVEHYDRVLMEPLALERAPARASGAGIPGMPACPW